MMLQLPQLEAKGTVERMAAPNVIKIVSDTQQPWFLRFSPETKVEITGKAKPDMLVPGTYISFVANVNQKASRVEEKVGKVTIFVPSIKAQIGAIPEQEAALAASAIGMNMGPGMNPAGRPHPAGGAKPGARAAGPGAGPAPFGLDLGPGQSFGAGPARGAGKPPAKGRAATEAFEIRGQIASIKAGKITLYVPNQYFKPSLKVELTDDPEVDIGIEGLIRQCPPLGSLLQPGDKIEAKGRQVAENGGDVTEMKITLRSPVSADSQAQTAKKPHTKPGPVGRSKKPKETEDASDEKPDKETDKERVGANDLRKGRPKAAAKEAKDDDVVIEGQDDETPAKPKRPQRGSSPQQTKGTESGDHQDSPKGEAQDN